MSASSAAFDSAVGGERGIPVSVCIPVKNEETHLAACLASLEGMFNDVVVIDSQSTDGTCRIALACGARVEQFHWNGRIPKKRNWALRHVPLRHDWVLFLDADERLTRQAIDEIGRVVPATQHVGMWLRFTNTFMGQPLRYGDQMRKLALFRKDAGEYETFPEDLWSTLDMEVHEHPILRGSTGEIRAPLDHRDDRGLHHYIAKHNEYSTWEARRYAWIYGDATRMADLSSRQRFKYRHVNKWWLANAYFAASYVLKRGFLDGIAGWRFAALKRRYFQDVRLKIIQQQAERDSQSVK